MFFNKLKKFFLISFIFFVIISLFYFTFNSKGRRTILTYIFVTHDYYQSKRLTSDINNRNFLAASKKLIQYINISKKLSPDSGYMVNGIYDAVELVVDRAVHQEDYNHLENVFSELLLMEPNSYKPNVWLARAYADNNLDMSLNLLEKAITISPAQEDAFRELLRISNTYNINSFNKKYCDIYKKSQSGGITSNKYSSFFTSYNIKSFALSFNNASKKNIFYINDGIVIENLQNYEFIPKKRIIVNSVNLYFSFLPGMNVEISQIEIFSKNNKLLIPSSAIIASSKYGYFKNNKNISLYLLKLTDDILTINFNSDFYKKNKKSFQDVDKVKILMNFKKLNLSNNLICKN